MDVQRAIIAQKVQVFLLVMTCCQIRPKQNKNIHSNNSKKFGVHKATIYRWLNKIEQKVHNMANQNGLQSLQKI